MTYETEYQQFLCKFGAQFATSLRNAPLTNAPFSGFLSVGVQNPFSSLILSTNSSVSLAEIGQKGQTSDKIGFAKAPAKIGKENRLICQLFWGNSRYAVTIFSSETIIFFMQLHLPHFLWDSLQCAIAALSGLGIIYSLSAGNSLNNDQGKN